MPKKRPPKEWSKKNGHNGNAKTKKKAKNLVVIQLSGGNDYLNTVVSYQDGLY